MGTLYREVVEYRHLKVIRLILRFVYVILAADAAFILYILRGSIEGTIYIGLSIMLLAMLGGIMLWGKCKKRYRYGIIDRELIIERLSGHKRKVELNINLKHVISLDRIDEASSNFECAEQHTFTCTGKRDQIYKCVFEKDGKYYSFNFQPSCDLLKKIEKYK